MRTYRLLGSRVAGGMTRRWTFCTKRSPRSVDQRIPPYWRRLRSSASAEYWRLEITLTQTAERIYASPVTQACRSAVSDRDIGLSSWAGVGTDNRTVIPTSEPVRHPATTKNDLENGPKIAGFWRTSLAFCGTTQERKKEPKLLLLRSLDFNRTPWNQFRERVKGIEPSS
jgi:hypothetical protein